VRRLTIAVLAIGIASLQAIAVPAGASAVGELTYQGCIANGGASGCVDAAQDSLGGAEGVAVSPDGKSVYVASFSGDSVTAFSRDPLTGSFAFQGCIANGGANGCVDPPQDSLGAADGVAVSPDGKSVYVASFSGNSITHLTRNTSTGALSYQGCIANGGANGCVDPPQDSLGVPAGVAVSPDNKSVYVTAGNSITHLTRDTSNGLISYQGCIANGGANGCVDPPQDSLATAEGVAVSPDGKSVYVASGGGNSLTGFARALTSGQAAPSNSFKFGRTRLNKRKGTATIVVIVPGPGTLSLTGKGLVKQRPVGVSHAASAVAKTVSAAGKVKLKVRSKGTKKRKLNRSGKLKVKATVTYTPTGGDPNTKVKRIKLIKLR
jgi:sugar lactone lactonase YvrE